MRLSPYSVGWGSSRDNGLTVSAHDGSAGTFYCHAVVARELDLAVAVMGNSATEETARIFGSLSRRIIRVYRRR